MLEATSSMLGDHFRLFVNTTCSAFKTVESSAEYGAQVTRVSKAKKKKDVATPTVPPVGEVQNAVPTSARDELPPTQTMQAEAMQVDSDGERLAGSAQADGPLRPVPTQADRLGKRGQSSTQTKARSKNPTHQPADHTPIDPPQSSSPRGKGRQVKTFNINTYKFHALADYPAAIRRFGTTDSYSTERV